MDFPALKDNRSGNSELSQTTAKETGSSPQEQGGGVTGYLKSWIGGSPTETTPQGDAKTTHTQELQDGRSAAVRTAPDQATVPHTLRESSQPVGAAKTEVSEPVSQYASALEDIAGPPVAPDPAAKYGPALGPLTGDAPASGTDTGVLGAVTAAAGSVVQTVKQVVGYEEEPEATPRSSNTASAAPDIMYESEPAIEKTVQPLSGSSAYESSPGDSTGGSLTPADLPKSGVVNPAGDGSAEISAKQQPGYLSSAAGTVSDAAAGLRNTVAGFVGGSGNSGYGGSAYNGGSSGLSSGPSNITPASSQPGTDTTRGINALSANEASNLPSVMYEDEEATAAAGRSSAPDATLDSRPGAPDYDPGSSAQAGYTGPSTQSTTKSSAPTSAQTRSVDFQSIPDVSSTKPTGVTDKPKGAIAAPTPSTAPQSGSQAIPTGTSTGQTGVTGAPSTTGASAAPTTMGASTVPTSFTDPQSGSIAVPNETSTGSSRTAAAPTAAQSGTTASTIVGEKASGPSDSTAAPSTSTAAPSTSTAAPSTSTVAPSTSTAAPSTKGLTGVSGATEGPIAAQPGSLGTSEATAAPSEATTGNSATKATPPVASGPSTSAGTSTPASGKAAAAAQEDLSSVKGSSSQPPKSAFASKAQTPTGGKKEEISEEIAAKTGTQSGKEKEAMAAATKDAEGLGVGKAGTPSSTVTGGATKSETASQATKQSEKEKSKCCGCVIQ